MKFANSRNFGPKSLVGGFLEPRPREPISEPHIQTLAATMSSTAVAAPNYNFNIGFESANRELRHGVAFSFEPSRSKPWDELSETLKPKVALLLYLTNSYR